MLFDIYRSLEFLNDQHHGEDRVRLGRSYPDNSDEDNESNEVVIRVRGTHINYIQIYIVRLNVFTFFLPFLRVYTTYREV